MKEYEHIYVAIVGSMRLILYTQTARPKRPRPKRLRTKQPDQNGQTEKSCSGQTSAGVNGIAGINEIFCNCTPENF